MWKKLALSGFALLLLAASNLRLCCRMQAGGRDLEGCYSLRDADRAAEAAAWAAEEILREPSPGPEAERRFCLRFGSPDGDRQALTGALLRSVPGVKLADVAFVNGVRLGIVEDGEELRRRLDRFIGSQMPTAAVSGGISGRLEIRQLYSRSDQAVNYDDMVLLVSGMAPVLYVDENGKLV